MVMRSVAALLFLALVSASPAFAQTVEVAPGVHVKKKTYPVPKNEQPFYGLAPKTPYLAAEDEKFVTGIVQSLGSRERALDETLRRGWSAFRSGDLVVASRRFNQAYLIAPEQSRVYHAFAALVETRFNDTDYADELFRIALKQPDPAETLRADYGRLLLITKRPADALPILEQAVVDAPKFGNAWSNLGFARLQTGDRSGACAAAAEAEKLVNHEIVNSDIALLKRAAQCGNRADGQRTRISPA
jgi:predicted Zn-dependent protease